MSIPKEQQDRAVERLESKMKGLMTLCGVFLQRVKVASSVPTLQSKSVTEKKPRPAPKPSMQ